MKELALHGGYSARVDDSDYDVLSIFTWVIQHAKNTSYVYRWGEGRKKVYLHRQLLGFPRGHVDHRDHNGLNNCRDNLRAATSSLNAGHMVSSNQRAGRFRGVYRDNPGGNWSARIVVGRKTIRLGVSRHPQEAALLYDAAARLHFGQFANCNHPDES